MIDTHTHLYMPDAYPDGGAEAVERAIEAGVSQMIFPCVDLASLESMRKLHALFPVNTHLALGLHPTELGTDWQDTLKKMEAMLPGDFIAVGEVGIDLYHDAENVEAQRIAFSTQLGWASRYGLPVIIHCREGLKETLEIIATHKEKLPPLLFHSFTGSKDDVLKIREVCDPYFGINGVVTFKNAPALREALSEIGIDRIVLETDAPWLSPVPFRGRQNESSRIPYIRDCVADTLAISPHEVETMTDKNAKSLFRI